jgi:acid phosphatase
MLDKARKDKKWTAAIEQKAAYAKLPPAVILDIDETVLDNVMEEAEAAKSGYKTGMWEEWVKQERAAALPGAVEFCKYAASKGVAVFYVSNRDAALEPSTLKNLDRLGFPLQKAADSLLLRGERPEWGSDKGTRRTVLAEKYRILLLIGDDFGDFLSNVRVSLEERRKLATEYASRWGERWIMLPNPMYGSWETALYGNQTSLSREEKLRLKRELLKGMR